MSAKAIREATGKIILNKFLEDVISPCKLVSVDENTSFKELIYNNEWLKNNSLVVKPDQLIKRRGKLNLVYANKNIKEIENWVNVKIGKELKIGRAVGKLKKFIIEPFVPHCQEEEFYLCIYSKRDGDVILFHHEGGVDIGDVDSKAFKLFVEIEKFPTIASIIDTLLKNVSPQKINKIALFISSLYSVYVKLYFTYLEINPFVFKDEIYILDLAAKLDSTAEYICKRDWGDVDFPPPFGRDAFPEEKYISDLDAKSGASLKLTILNKNGRIWTMVAGGGASVIYADTICQLGAASELANYGEYSGAPSEQQTYEYAKTILSLMTSHKHPDGKILIIGGGIANFTNVAATFKGIVRALKEFQSQLIEHKASIFVRRAGPNYQEGLRVMREIGNTLGVPVHVFGAETHMTAIVSMAMGKRQIPNLPEPEATTANFVLVGRQDSIVNNNSSESKVNLNDIPINIQNKVEQNLVLNTDIKASLFNVNTKAIVWGMQTRAVQNMLDFDYVCSRKEGSVVALVYPFTEDHKLKFYWGQKEIMIPVYKEMSNAINKHPQADVLINFASLRSAYDSTMKTLEFPQIRTIAIIAEGIPENLTRKMNKKANKLGVTIIGPATVGGIKPGCFKIGNTGGMMDNILLSNLFRPGSVAYVSRSGGMSNELNNIIARASDGVYEGIAIGGDRYPGTTFLDHLLRYQNNTDVKLMVLLGEVGGVEEYQIVDAIKTGKITKPLVAWCIGTCSSMFNSEVQFGHAGSSANSENETAVAKNKALKDVGVIVPDSFDELGVAIKNVYDDLVSKGLIILKPEVAPPTVPMDYNWARELGLIRKPASFMTSICDERGNELLYAGIPITSVIKENLGLGGTLGLLWFQRRLPLYANKFLEMCLMVTADHGPAVSGAHNTIVCARAGKDLVSSLVSGLLTIGDRFGGALDGAARQFSKAYDSGLLPNEFVNEMRKEGKLILGIGHRVKSLNNPDMRVNLMKEYVKENFPNTPLLDYALEVEKITTSKKPNLILNVDGIIGVATVDLLRNSGLFTLEEAQEYIDIGALNGMFVLGRTVGFIGHYLDQKRLKQGLYRHPWDDISYVLPETQI